MAGRYSSCYIPRCTFTLFILILFGTLSISCTTAAQAQTVTQTTSAKAQKSDAPLKRTVAKKKTTRVAVRRRLSDKAAAPGQSHSQLGVWHPFGPSHDTPKPGLDVTVQNIYAHRSMAGLERQMWLLINQDRSNPETFAETGGQSQPLKWNESLAAVAKAHSRNMLEQQFFSHVDAQGRTYEMRIDQAGIVWWAAGENIAINDSVLRAEAGFMNEPRLQPNHRYNILNRFYTDVGIGIVQGPDGALYITQAFVQSPPQSAGVRSGP